MEPITVKVSALLVMVQAISNAQMDYVTLSTQSLPGDDAGYLHFEAFKKEDPDMGFTFQPVDLVGKDEFASTMAKTVSAMFSPAGTFKEQERREH